MKKWFAEDYAFTITVTGFLHGDQTENYCRNGEEIGDVYHCTYGCPVNADGCGICSKTIVCPDGCVMFRLTAKPLGGENFFRGGFWKEP